MAMIKIPRTIDWLPILMLSTIVAITIGIVFQIVVMYDEKLSLEKERGTIVDNALSTSGQLESQINSVVFLANGLAAMMAANPDSSPQSINLTLQILHKSNPTLKNIAVAPGNIIRYVYPLQGNKKIIGLFYRNLPDQWPMIEKSIRERKTILAGPVKLKQGGNGFVSRTPVYMDDGQYWGAVSLVVDSDVLLRRVSEKAKSLGLEVSIRGKDGLGEKGEIFYGSHDVFRGNAYLMQIHVPGGTWQLAFKPLNSPANDSAAFIIHWQIIAGWVVSLIVGLLTFLFLRSQQTIKSDGKRFRSILESTKDAIIISDESGLIDTFNKSAVDMFGYSMDEIRGRSLNTLMTAEDSVHHDNYLRGHTSKTPIHMAKNREIIGLRKDGSTFPLEVNVSSFTISGNKQFSGIMRDISERKKIQQRLMEMANTDELTKILNRRAFMEIFQHHFLLAKRHKHPLSLLMMDADHFKSVNDNYGHDSGDMVLIELSKVTKSFLRATDAFGRLGGEEFAILLPETEPSTALHTAERLVRAIANTPIQLRTHQTINITVSIGVASLSENTENIEELLIQADQLLYRAKQSGRNRADCSPDNPAGR